MSYSYTPFSDRNNFSGPETKITIREDAPEIIRDGIVILADNLGLSPSNARLEVCGILLKRPNQSNWSDYPNVFGEVQQLVDDCPWYKVYDIAEGFYQRLEQTGKAQDFQLRLNTLFRENGIGWQMVNGLIVPRTSEAFAQTSAQASSVLNLAGKQTAANEIHEALNDISRRPADITGAIQHAMAALECVAREATGQPKKRLSQLIPNLNLPKPLDTALEGMWGFASEQGRHIREGRNPRFEEAELVVTVASAVAVYLVRAGIEELN